MRDPMNKVGTPHPDSWIHPKTTVKKPAEVLGAEASLGGRAGGRRLVLDPWVPDLARRLDAPSSRRQDGQVSPGPTRPVATAAQWPRTRHGVFLVFLTTKAAGENAAPDAATAAAISDEMQQGQLDP